MTVVLIGSGNTANVLGKIIIRANHKVAQVCGRNKAAVARLAKELKTNAETNFKKIFTGADIYIIAVADDAVESVSLQLNLKNKVVVHTAGAVSKNILENISTAFGVIYPLQSLRKELDYLPEMPLLVDGNNKKVTGKIIDFAKTISKNVAQANDETRLKLHVAAVIISNFTNHLFTLAKDFCAN